MIAEQFDLFGNSHYTGDVVAKITHLLETEHGCRNDYAELIAQFWLHFDGLDLVIPPECHDVFVRWMVNSATSPKTITNRAMEIQKQRPELDADPGVRQERNRKATQGPVR